MGQQSSSEQRDRASTTGRSSAARALAAVPAPGRDREPPTARLRPVTGERTVHRARLLDAVDDAVQRPLTLVAAPAGSGKTVLLGDWATQQPEQTVAWLTLDARDNDRGSFWNDVTAALMHATGHGPDAFDGLDVPAHGRLDRFVSKVAGAVADHDRPVVVVLDDAQEVRSADVLHDIDTLLAQSGPGLHVVWATRVDPSLRLQRLRVAGGLSELRLHDLEFTLPETQLLLDDVPDLATTDLERVWRATHGWAAGLRIAALGLRDHDDPHAFATRFAGDQRQILDYLRDEIVAELPEDTTEFLLRTAGVDELSAPLAEALTDAADSARILDDLVRRGLIDVADGKPDAFRYHPLFADSLRALQRQRIDAELPDLHRRAARWYAADGRPADAIRHASHAEDWALAGSLAAEHWITVGLAGHAPTIRSLVARFPPSVIHDDAEIALAVAGLALEDGDEEEADYFLEVAAARAPELPDDRRHRYEVHVAATALYRGSPDADPRTTIDAGRRALRTRWDRDMEPSLRAQARLSVGVAQLWLGDTHAASSELEQAAALADEGRNAYLAVQSLGWSAIVDAIEGRLVEAHRGAEAALARADRDDAIDHPQVAAALAALGVVRWQWNQIDRAEDAIGRARSVLGGSGNRTLRALVAIVGARLRAVRGEPETGLRLLRPATADHDGYRLPPLLVDGVDGATALLRLQLGELDRAAALVRTLERSPRGMPLATAAAVRLGLRDPEGALRAADRLLASTEILPLPEIVGRVSRAVALDMLGEPDAAETALERALDLAEPRGYRRPLLDAGARVGLLLRRLVRRGTAHRALVGELLIAFEGARSAGPSSAGPAVAPVSEPLSTRELTVLRYMPTTLPYPEIASELFVSVNTIKTHVRHIYRKLGVDNRRDAVSRARALRLLGPAGR